MARGTRSGRCWSGWIWRWLSPYGLDRNSGRMGAGLTVQAILA
jgi:hypothetical protein